MNHRKNILLKYPDFKAMKNAGFTITDMHFHSRYSDTFTRISSILKRAARQGINVALTDHNLINGVEVAYNNRLKVNVLPGIEVGCKEGHHILVYFPSLDDLREFYWKHIDGHQSNDPFSNTNITTLELLDTCDKFNCLTVAAHPFTPGYWGIYRNLTRGFISSDVLDRIHAIEAISGGISRKNNIKAIELIHNTEKPFTGGSDGHTLGDLGRVVVCTKAKTNEGIINEIKARNNLVVGMENETRHKMLAAFKISVRHLPYLRSTVRWKYDNIYKKSFRYFKKRLGDKIEEIEEKLP